jgi:hypothetical protein
MMFKRRGMTKMRGHRQHGDRTVPDSQSNAHTCATVRILAHTGPPSRPIADAPHIFWELYLWLALILYEIKSLGIWTYWDKLNKATKDTKAAKELRKRKFDQKLIAQSRRLMAR